MLQNQVCKYGTTHLLMYIPAMARHRLKNTSADTELSGLRQNFDTTTGSASVVVRDAGPPPTTYPSCNWGGARKAAMHVIVMGTCVVGENGDDIMMCIRVCSMCVFQASCANKNKPTHATPPAPPPPKPTCICWLASSTAGAGVC